MKKSLLLIALPALMALPLQAQQTDAGQKQRQSFEEFRKGLHDNYNSFRKGVLDRYDKFLDGIWTEFQQFKGESADSKPKPTIAPSADDYKPVEHPVPVVKLPPVSPDKPEPANTATEPKKPREPKKPEPKTPVPNLPQLPVVPAVPDIPIPPKVVEKSRSDFDFGFYETPVSMPDTDIKLATKLNNTRDYAEQWRKLAKDPEAQVLLQEVEKKAYELGLNDYLKYELASSYVDARYSGADATSRMSLKHFLLANMGYGVRLGVNGNGKALLLIPFNQQVYARMFIKVDDKKFYVFGNEGDDPNVKGNMTISTCQLPKNNDPGMSMDLRLNGLKLPYVPHKYDLSFKDLHISGEVNASIFPVLYRYPQMPTADFACSSVCQDVRDDIVKQFKTQLAGKDERQAVDDLLQFVQGAFEYATDGEFHGFEKPYFFEETLFYPKCDCEDRAIFYTYLLWNVLGVENHLINYPGHESASVKLSEPIKGDAYDFGGSRFYISDPTYIGARTGMCMPNYLNDAPGIDYHYKNL